MYPPYYGGVTFWAGAYGYGWSAYGPYGGAGYGARYNPATGVYSRGGYAYGPGGAAAWRTGYNPSTGTWAGQRGGANAYGSWKQGAVTNGSDWARGGSVSNSQGTLRGFQTSGGAAGIGGLGEPGLRLRRQGRPGERLRGPRRQRLQEGPERELVAAATPKGSEGASTSKILVGLDAGTRDSLNHDYRAGSPAARRHPRTRDAARTAAAGRSAGEGAGASVAAEGTKRRKVLRATAVAAAGVVLLAVIAVALAPWWIDLKPVRERVERAASTALAGTLTFERIELSWFPRAEVVVPLREGGSCPGRARHRPERARRRPRSFRSSAAGSCSRSVGVDGLDLAVDLRARRRSRSDPRRLRPPDWKQALSLAGLRDAGRRRGPEPCGPVARGAREPRARRPARRGRAPRGGREGRAHALASLAGFPAAPRRGVAAGGRGRPARGAGRARERARRDGACARSSSLFAGDDPTIAAIFAIVPGRHADVLLLRVGREARPAISGFSSGCRSAPPLQDAKVRIAGPGLDLADVAADVALEGGVLSAENAEARVGKSRASDGKRPDRPREGRRPPARGGAGAGRPRRGARDPRARDREPVLPSGARARGGPAGERDGPAHDRRPQERAEDERRRVGDAVLGELPRGSRGRSRCGAGGSSSTGRASA